MFFCREGNDDSFPQGRAVALPDSSQLILPRGGPFLLASSLDLLGYGRFAGKENVPRSLSYQFVKDALARTIEQEGPESIAAFIATPIIGGTVGAITPPPDYFARICEICDDYDVLLIMDEVITGFGRLGINFGIDHWQISPDIITVAKSLSSGYAAHGAVIVHKKIWFTFADGKRKRITLLSTFAGIGTNNCHRLWAKTGCC